MLNKDGEILAERTVEVIKPILRTSKPDEIYRRGNLDLNRYISSKVKPSSYYISNRGNQ